MKKLSTVVFSTLLFAAASLNAQPVQNQWDNFQNGTTQNWTSGGSNPNGPVNIADGGPSGAGDGYLLASSNGGSGAGGKLVIYNENQWTGDFTAAGVTSISMHVNNFGTTDLLLRAAFDGSGGAFWSVNAEPVPAGSGWMTVIFSIQTFDLTGGANAASTLAGVSTMRILHSVNGAWQGDNVTAQLGIDDITAAAQPLPVELVSFSALLVNKNVILNWVTSSEKNNFGFEVERKLNNETWHTAGFVSGMGTSTEINKYSFINDITEVSLNKIFYRLKQIDFSGEFSLSDEVEIANNIPDNFELSQNFPNPFNPSTEINFRLKEASKISIKIFDILGNEIRTLVNEEKDAGSYSVKWNGENNSGSKAVSGLYLYKMEAGSFVEIKKMTLLK